MAKINISKIIGKGYREYWNSRKRYVVCKGSRGSKKSKTTALWIIYNMMKHRDANTLVVRRIFNTLKDSCWTDLKWATYQLGVDHLWKFSKSPLEAIYIPTGQKILFRGLDNPMSITSITVEKGILCWCWFEEAFQIPTEDDFNKVDMSIRGQLPEDLFFRIMVTFNPWSEKHWLKKKFYDAPDPNTLAITTDYRCNEWIGKDFIILMDQMKENNPRRYNIEGLGQWGVAEGLVFENFIEQEFDYTEISKLPNVRSAFGLDFGYTNDPTAFIAALIDDHTKIIYVYDEHYQKAMTNQDIAKMLKYKGYAKEVIIADAAEPKSIQEIKVAGIPRIRAAAKGKDSILNGIQFIQNYKLIVHPNCANTLIELNNYIWDNKQGQTVNKPIDAFNHLMDALRYAFSHQIKPKATITNKNIFNI